MEIREACVSAGTRAHALVFYLPLCVLERARFASDARLADESPLRVEVIVEFVRRIVVVCTRDVKAASFEAVLRFRDGELLRRSHLGVVNFSAYLVRVLVEAGAWQLL